MDINYKKARLCMGSKIYMDFFFMLNNTSQFAIDQMDIVTELAKLHPPQTKGVHRGKSAAPVYHLSNLIPSLLSE